MLAPKRILHRKVQRGSMKGQAKGNTELHFGEFGIQALEAHWITNRQIEAARIAMTRYMKRGGRVYITIFPDKPTGAVYSKETLLAIAQLAREHHLLLLADEIYDRLVLENLPTYSLAALAPDVPCVTFNGLSKSHIICGFRCGWMVFSGPKEELAGIEQGVMQLAAMRLCGNALTQLVIPAALSDPDSTRAMMAPGGRLFEQSKATVEALAKIPGVTQVPNRAAFYLFPGLEKDVFDFESDEDFAMRFLHEKHVLVIPGHGFDWFEDLRFRIVMLPEPQVITQAMEQLGDFLERHRR